MKLVDANVLLYAVDASAERHAAAKRWLDTALNGAETVLLPWISTLAFVRVLTHPRIHPDPASVETACAVVEGWLARPNVVVPEADRQHLRRLRQLLVGAGGRGGNLVNDAHLAALALQWDADVVTFDADFDRFPGVRRLTPA